MEPLRRPFVRSRSFAVNALLLFAGFACDRPIEHTSTSPPLAQPGAVPTTVLPRVGISELEPGATLPTAAGQTIYLPIFGEIASDRTQTTVPLAVTVSVRNTDETKPIIVAVVRHRDADGRTIREYLRPPARLAPRASLDFAIKPAEIGVSSASVLVEWVADRPVNDPLVEAVMVGSIGGQGLSFVERGQVIDDKSKPNGAPPR
jgi:hypothetical protein